MRPEKEPDGCSSLEDVPYRLSCCVGRRCQPRPRHAMINWLGDRPKYAIGHCQQCGYDLTGLSSTRCPECGISRTAWIEALCEECGRSSVFSREQGETVQECPFCRKHMDVPPAAQCRVIDGQKLEPSRIAIIPFLIVWFLVTLAAFAVLMATSMVALFLLNHQPPGWRTRISLAGLALIAALCIGTRIAGRSCRR
jgi:hypothetical protein